MKRMHLNFEYDKLNYVTLWGKSRFNCRSNKIHSDSKPMNDFYWERFESIDDKAIAMGNYKFVSYNDLYNNLVKPFKKGY